MLFVPRYSVKLVEHDGKHFYQIGDDPTFYPGVTGALNCIAKPALVPWSARETAFYMARMIKKVLNAKRKPDDRFIETMISRAKKQHAFNRDKAAEVGTAAHKDFDDYVNQVLAGKKPEKVKNEYADSFHYFLEKEKLGIIMGDTKVGSKIFKFGGSIDIGLADEAGRLVIGDYKTGNGIYDTHAYQAGGGYSQAAKETFGLDYFPDAVIFRFIKGRMAYERREVRDGDHARQGFQLALDLSACLEQVHFKNRKTIKPKKGELTNAPTSKTNAV